MKKNKVSINQPYFFPYIGYYQLLFNSDIFVIYDDVDFINRGWINRNYIRGNKDERIRFTIPITKLSSVKKINELSIYNVDSFSNKFEKTLKQYYSKALNFSEVFELIRYALKTDSISECATRSLEAVNDYLHLNKKIVKSSINFDNTVNIHGAERIYEICKLTNATNYVNLIGGTNLYKFDEFEKRNIKLNFLQTKSNNNFSFIDLLMNKSKNEIINELQNFSLL